LSLFITLCSSFSISTNDQDISPGSTRLTLNAYLTPSNTTTAAAPPRKVVTQTASASRDSGSGSSGGNSGNQQADAMEFFTFFLDSLHEKMRMVGVDGAEWLQNASHADSYRGDSGWW